MSFVCLCPGERLASTCVLPGGWPTSTRQSHAVSTIYPHCSHTRPLFGNPGARGGAWRLGFVPARQRFPGRAPRAGNGCRAGVARHDAADHGARGVPVAEAAHGEPERLLVRVQALGGAPEHERHGVLRRCRYRFPAPIKPSAWAWVTSAESRACWVASARSSAKYAPSGATRIAAPLPYEPWP